jgi:hypothetical protein
MDRIEAYAVHVEADFVHIELDAVRVRPDLDRARLRADRDAPAAGESSRPVSKVGLGSSALHGANRDEILVPHRADIALSQRHHGLRAASRRHELDLEPVRRVDLHDGTEIAAPQSVFWNVAVKNHRIEFPESHRRHPEKAASGRQATSTAA